MSAITNFYYAEVDAQEFSCFIYFTTMPPIPAEASFFVSVNNSWKVAFPNEINPGEYYQRVSDLVEGDNAVALRIEYKGEVYTSETINVLLTLTDKPEVTPPREPEPPIVNVNDVSIIRRVPCLVKYTIDSDHPVIQHSYSEDNGATWEVIEPTYENGTYSFTKYYKKAGEYKILVRCMNNYWDISEPSEGIITVKAGEGDEPGLHASDSKDFVIQIAVPEAPPEPERPTIYYVVEAAKYTDKSLADNAKKILEGKGYTIHIETIQN